MVFQQILNGLMLGAVYGLAGIGLTLLWAVLKFVYIAHGNIIIVGAYTGFFVGLYTGSTLLAVAAAILVPVVLNVALNHGLFAKVRLESHLVPLMISIGVGIMIEELLAKLFYGGRPITYPNEIQMLEMYTLGPVHVDQGHLVGLGMTVVVMLLFYFLLFRSKLGMGLRAMAENPRVARMLGIKEDRMAALAFILAGSVSGLSGVFYGLIYAGISPYVGGLFTFKALAVMLFAGAGNVSGALAAGFILGMIEVIAVSSGMGMWRDMLAFGIMIIVLILRPQGLFGTIYEVD